MQKETIAVLAQDEVTANGLEAIIDTFNDSHQIFQVVGEVSDANFNSEVPPITAAIIGAGRNEAEIVRKVNYLRYKFGDIYIAVVGGDSKIQKADKNLGIPLNRKELKQDLLGIEH